MSLSKSFASLVKYNNGEFKSPKQAKFLLSQCDNNTYTTSDQVYNNTYVLFYHCDDTGVKEVTKHTPKTGKTVTTWKRKIDGILSMAEESHIKQLHKQKKQLLRRIAGRENEKIRGEYTDMAAYERHMATDTEQVRLIDLKIASIHEFA